MSRGRVSTNAERRIVHVICDVTIRRANVIYETVLSFFFDNEMINYC